MIGWLDRLRVELVDRVQRIRRNVGKVVNQEVIHVSDVVESFCRCKDGAFVRVIAVASNP